MTQREETSPADDACLARRLRAGDEAAFEELVRRHGRRVHAYALKRLRSSEAEDVVQDVFLQVFRSIDRFEGRSSLLVWIFGIAHHQVCNRFRRRALETTALGDAAERVADPAPLHDRRIDAARALERCEEVLEDAVTPGQRHVFSLRYLASRPVSAIAGETRKSEGAVRIGLLRTRRTLRERAPEALALLAS